MNRLSVSVGAVFLWVSAACAQGPFTLFHDDSVLIGFDASAAEALVDSHRGWIDTNIVLVDLKICIGDSIGLAVRPDSAARKVIAEYQPVFTAMDYRTYRHSVTDTLATWTTVSWTNHWTNAIVDTIDTKNVLYTSHLWRDWGDAIRFRFRTTANDTTTADSLETHSADLNFQVRAQESAATR